MAGPVSDIPSPQGVQNSLADGQRVCAVVTENWREEMQASLERFMDEGLESGHPADLAVTIWLRVDAALSSVFGQHGVSTLFRRSLYLAQAKYPWLEEVKPTATAVSDFDALRVVLAQHDPSVARAAHTWLLKTFCDLLIKLIGGLLSQSLLQPVWCPLTIGPATPQETRQ